MNLDYDATRREFVGVTQLSDGDCREVRIPAAQILKAAVSHRADVLGDAFPGKREATLRGLRQLVEEDKYNGFIGETCRNAIALIERGLGLATPVERSGVHNPARSEQSDSLHQASRFCSETVVINSAPHVCELYAGHTGDHRCEMHGVSWVGA